MIAQRLQGVYRELDYGDVGLRVHMRKHTPCSVVQSPLILVQAYPGRLYRLCDFRGNVGCAGGGVLEGIEFGGKAIEVMDGSRPRHGSNCRGPDVPMGRNDQQRAWPGEILANLTPCVRVAVRSKRIHRVSMPDEQGG